MNSAPLLSFIFLAMMLMFTSCRDKKEEPVPVPPPDPKHDCGKTQLHDIDPTLIQQFLFNAGSYWIYQDSVTGTIDSCYNYMSRIRSGTFVTGGGMGIAPCFYYYSCALDSLNQPMFSPYIYYIQGTSIRLIEPFGYGMVGLCYNDAGTLKGDSLSTFHPSITIHGVSYADVHRFHFYSPYWTYNKEGYYYLKPGIGILKIELITRDSVPVRKVLELVRYKV